MNFFTWTIANILGINTEAIYHHLRADPTYWPKKQKRRSLAPKRQEVITEEAKVTRWNFNLNSTNLCMYYQWCNHAFYGNKTCRATSLWWAPEFSKNYFLLLLEILNHNDGQLTWRITYQTLRRPSRVHTTARACCRHKIPLARRREVLDVASIRSS